MTPRESPVLAGLPNLGPASHRMLAQAGITTLAQLRALGSVAAFGQVRRSGATPSLNLLWALEGALTGLPWQEVAREHRTSLLLALDAHEHGAPRLAPAPPGGRRAPDRAGAGAVRLMRFPGARRREPAVDAWFDARPGDLGALARRWFDAMRACGDDVREVLHDDYPTACVGDAAFAYVGAFKAHVNVGFFRGTALADPAGLLEGTGKAMRHVKVRPGKAHDAAALLELVGAAHADMRLCVRAIEGAA